MEVTPLETQLKILPATPLVDSAAFVALSATLESLDSFLVASLATSVAVSDAPPPILSQALPMT